MSAKGERTRQKILKDATCLFQVQGFGATSINELLAATGVTKGSLYFHFSSKDEVGLEVLSRARKAFMAFLDEALTGETPGAALNNFFRQALEKHRGSSFVGG